MPANLTPEYRKAEKEYRAAKTPQEKLVCLEHMLRVMPKHKGTDHLQADLKRRISRLREESAPKGGKSKRAPLFKVEKEGAGQIVLLGPPNTGKSRLVASLTNAPVNVAEYPFSTHVPQPGMTDFEDVQIQLVDTPPITADYMETWMPDTVRRADRALIVADLGDDNILDTLDVVLKRLSGVKIELGRDIPQNPEEITRTYRPAALLANKSDLAGAAGRLEILREFYADRFDIWSVSARTGNGLDDIRRNLFDFLDIIRIFTKEPGRKPDLARPYTVPAGSTVIDLAVKVHREFEHTLKSARIWGSGKYDGIHVKRDHVLSDKDILELHE